MLQMCILTPTTPRECELGHSRKHSPGAPRTPGGLGSFFQLLAEQFAEQFAEQLAEQVPRP